ncbi:MAG TPA: DUF2934 domain-containing protein [Phycisphaerales bacterium]|nr:DUF2934 domain-containing protein [Phycisphaerales bacterium]
MPAAAPEPHTVAAPREPTEEQVRLRAYELYVARGRVDGHAMEDWMQAERELRARAMD